LWYYFADQKVVLLPAAMEMLEVYDEMMILYEQNKGRTQGTNGLDEGYPPHIRNCIEIYFA
jgi:hypothetical protein